MNQPRPKALLLLFDTATTEQYQKVVGGPGDEVTYEFVFITCQSFAYFYWIGNYSAIKSRTIVYF